MTALHRQLAKVFLLMFGAALTGRLDAQVPEPTGWYSGDMHVHRSCGGAPVPVSTILSAMNNRNLAVVSLLADSGNGEVQNQTTDLPLVNGQDEPSSTTNRIIHWDAEWHWDATYTQYPFQALGGHIVQLGLSSAQLLISEYTYPIFQFTRQQGGIGGFAHLEYLDAGFPDTLNCCIPVEYPVEVALGSCDFISEDVTGGDSATSAYYRLLNCGFRPGFAGGSDYPCGASIGDVITYVQVSNGLTYRKWIDGIKAGQTVVSRNGHNEFLDLKVNSTSGPGSEIFLPAGGGNVTVNVNWTANQSLSGTIELVLNGNVVASTAASVSSTTSATLNTTVNLTNSGWLAARRTSARGHEVHTSAVYVTVNNAPVRASADDANFYVAWMDQLLLRTSPGGVWNHYFTTNLAEAQARYQAARTVFQQIATEAAAIQPVAITTTALDGGSLINTYSTTLTVSGGFAPYTWSISSGSLPPGLILNSSSGTITGTPTTTGTFNFTAAVADSSAPVKSTTKPFSITVTTFPVSTSIWASSVVPTLVDGGADSPVELGVKFRSDVAGTIFGIRFYKAANNIGVHVGNLWSSTGALLATATFSGESASGWQQVDFSTPVAISANTVYIASYHANNGHYSADLSYFATHGADNAPLHALADGISGANSIYSYGSLSAFPSQTWQSTNYWVDVSFIPATPPALSGISITPANPLIATGGTLQLTATGTFSDGSTKDLTSQVTWSSTNASRASINSTGLATGIAAGNVSILATLGSSIGSTTATIQTAPLAISTTSLSSGTVGTAYSATLTATGGTAPYTWSVITGSLPTGLTLNAITGTITGTPTAASTTNLTIQASDVGSPVQATNKAFLLTIAAVPTTSTIWPSTTVPGLVDGGADSPVELGVKFRSDVAGTVTGVRFYKATANTGTHVGNLWSSAGALLASVTFSGESASGWQQASFSAPVTIAANTVYVVSYHANSGHYSADLNYFTSTGFDRAPLHALATGVSGANGVYAYGATSLFPAQTWSAANYWVDLVFQPAVAATLSSIAVTPANSSVTVGATQQFAATGTYSDSSTQNLTTQATWASSAPSATINSAGLATSVSVGTTNISATFGSLSGSTALTIQPIPIAITTTALGNATVGTAYSSSLTATGGTTPYSWMVFAGTLPNGLALNPSTGAITGTPAAKGTFNFTIQVNDAGSVVQTTTKALSITVTATLTSIAVSPTTPSITFGGTQQFAATGTYSDSSTQNLTSQVTWASSAAARATINSAGLATSVSAGTTNISASFGSLSGATTLTIQPAPLVLSTTSLSSGTVGTPFSATLAATGGTAPYTWSVLTGSLPAGLTLNAITGAITGTPTAASTTNVTIQVSDAGSPVQATNKAFSLTIAAVPTTATIWPSTTVPGLVDSGADSPVELGVKFRSDVAGTVTGVRFYKATANTGTHVGNLWSTAGALLASVTFSGESTSGWQQASFSAPVTIAANTVYVVSYHANSGHYSADLNYFTSTGFDRAPLHALANGVSTFNGVYTYGSSSLFPTQTWNAANYWVDLVFQANSGADTTPPTVNLVTPASGEMATPINSVVVASFSESINPATITTANFFLSDANNVLIPASVSYSDTTKSATLTPTSLLNVASTYTLTVRGGVGGVADTAGNVLATNFVSSFSTITYGASGGGPGGPILVLTSATNPFSRYYSEILLAEGLNSFGSADIAAVNSATLASYDVVILGECTLSPAQVTLLTNWVNAGGHLIAMRPDKQLATLLGVTDIGQTLSNGYLLANTNSGPGVGIVAQTIQYHGTADLYLAGTATIVANLYSDAVTATFYPAVVTRNVGANGGQVAAFTFDLAKSIIQIRQGNPAWIDQNRDGLTPVRSDDLFYGAASFDPQPDWVNLNKVAIPQADEQQHLLANIVIAMNAAKRPLPRFWYFPHGYKAVVVMTGDDHGTTYGGFGGTKGRFDLYAAASPATGSVDDWEMIRSTSYVFPDPNGGLPTNLEAVNYTAAGFEISLHLDSGSANYTSDSLDALFVNQLAQWNALFPSLPAPVTHRIHAIAWSGYTILPEVELNHGIRLDTSYYFWPPGWVGDRPGLFTGSGLPMRYAKLDGNVVDVYQAVTQMTDESGQTYPYTIDTLLDRALGSEGYYGAFVANIHTDFPDEPENDAILLSATSRGVPIISARQLLTWTDARNSSAIKSISWTASTLSFTIVADARAHGLQTMIPLNTGQSVSSVSFNGAPIAYELKVIKGIQYAVIPTVSGSYQLVLVSGP